MESHHGKILTDKQIIAFGSNQKAPYYLLSNFAECIVHYRECNFPSSEHAFQSQLVNDYEKKNAFLNTGVLGDWEAGFKQFYKDNDVAQKKREYWKKKKNIGILAKMAIGKNKDKMHMTSEEAYKVFHEILLAKFNQNENLKQLLLDTGDAYLFEFDRSARRLDQLNPPRRVRWGAMIVEGVVIGHNQMGALLMKVREDLFREDKNVKEFKKEC